VAFTSITVTAEGTVARQDGATRFTEIVLPPRITIPPGGEGDRAIRIMQKSEATCLVTASLRAPGRLEPEVVTG
jgi:organic hydroperoxide reductase OsmC/OhrA